MNLLNEMPASAPTETSIKEQDYKDSLIQNYNTIIPQNHEKSSINCKNYSIDIFNQIKNMLDIKQVIEYYGISINNNGFASCPFHQEKNTVIQSLQR